MTERDAVKMLMLSPLYFKLTVLERSELLIHFYANHQVHQIPSPMTMHSKSLNRSNTCH